MNRYNLSGLYRMIGMALLGVMLIVPALATTTGTFDPSTLGTAFVSNFADLLTSIAPVVISILMVGLGFKLVMKFIRRGTKV